MFAFIIFITSLVIIILLFAMKSVEIYHGRKIYLEDLFIKCDNWIRNSILKIKFWWSHVNFRNTKLLFSWILVNIRKLIIAFKRRFDHKQAHFFIKRDHISGKSRASVSFFLKDVSDYKRKLREGGKIK